MSTPLRSVRPIVMPAWVFGALLAIAAQSSVANPADPGQAPGAYSLLTLVLVGAACSAAVIIAVLVILAKKNQALRAAQDEAASLRKELESIAITDSLTGLYNRRYMDAQLKMALSYARRRRMPLGIAIVDVDLFKAINDEHGHQRGDQVLKGVATAVQGVLRDEDVACRYGGEEFMLILPSTNLAGATTCAERLRSLVESKGLCGLKVTVSIGVASTEAHADLTAEELTERAEKALYAAKLHGRNLVMSEADDIGALQMPHKYGASSTSIH